MNQAADKPGPRKPDPEPNTVWMHYGQGNGVDHDGRYFDPILGGRRKNPKLIDRLETARHHYANRIMLCGEFPTNPVEWLLEDVPGWTNEGHYLTDPGMGRFRHTETGTRVDVLTAREWFPEGDTPLTPVQAQAAWNTLTEIVATAIGREWPLMRNPGQTGVNIWKLKMVDTTYSMELLDPDIGHQIQATEMQHRIVHLVDDGRTSCDCCVPLIPKGKTLGGFAYADGRFAYGGSVLSEQGAAPAFRLNAADAAELQTTAPFHPARYKIRFTVPEWWPTLGLFGVKDPNGIDWHWPNRPGSTWETWADGREVQLAKDDCGWDITILEGIKFTKANSLKPFSNVITKMLDLTDTWTIDGQPISPARKKVISAAIKHMFRVTIGMMSRRPHAITRVADSLDDVPDAAGAGVREHNGKYIYTVPSEKKVGDPGSWHPEIAALLWGNARTRVLSTPTALKKPGGRGVLKRGALEIDPSELIAIHGDAIFTEHIPRWTLPTSIDGGGDDGGYGRIRCKGYLPGPLPAPASNQRIALANKAEAAGVPDQIR